MEESRPKRLRFKTLEFWNNERVRYSYKGNILSVNAPLSSTINMPEDLYTSISSKNQIEIDQSKKNSTLPAQFNKNRKTKISNQKPEKVKRLKGYLSCENLSRSKGNVAESIGNILSPPKPKAAISLQNVLTKTREQNEGKRLSNLSSVASSERFKTPKTMPNGMVVNTTMNDAPVNANKEKNLSKRFAAMVSSPNNINETKVQRSHEYASNSSLTFNSKTKKSGLNGTKKPSSIKLNEDMSERSMQKKPLEISKEKNLSKSLKRIVSPPRKSLETKFLRSKKHVSNFSQRASLELDEVNKAKMPEEQQLPNKILSNLPEKEIPSEKISDLYTNNLKNKNIATVAPVKSTETSINRKISLRQKEVLPSLGLNNQNTNFDESQNSTEETYFEKTLSPAKKSLKKFNDKTYGKYTLQDPIVMLERIPEETDETTEELRTLQYTRNSSSENSSNSSLNIEAAPEKKGKNPSKPLVDISAINTEKEDEIFRLEDMELLRTNHDEEVKVARGPIHSKEKYATGFIFVNGPSFHWGHITHPREVFIIEGQGFMKFTVDESGDNFYVMFTSKETFNINPGGSVVFQHNGEGTLKLFVVYYFSEEEG